MAQGLITRLIKGLKMNVVYDIERIDEADVVINNVMDINYE